MASRRIALGRVLVGCIVLVGAAGVEAAETWDDRAAEFESARLVALVKNLRPVPNWISGEDRFWVRDETDEGVRFLVVEAATGATRDAFDHVAMAAALTAAGVEDATTEELPITALDLSGADIRVTTTAGGRYVCTAAASRCEQDDSPKPSVAERPSPDGGRVAFIKDHNIWLRDSTSGVETPLTKDGEPGFAYGDLGRDLSRVTRRRSGEPEPMNGVNWSPDGRWIAAMRVDVRDVPLRTCVTEYLPPDDTFTVTHMDHVVVPADRRALEREISVIDTTTGTKVVAGIDPAMLHDFAPLHFSTEQVWWNLDGGELFVVVASNGGQTYGIAAIDLATGESRTVVQESEAHYYAFSA